MVVKPIMLQTVVEKWQMMRPTLAAKCGFQNISFGYVTYLCVNSEPRHNRKADQSGLEETRQR
jgi:hypothetical protein